jgi:DEAD/DEAH box helicase domain-containing protein
MTQKDHMKDLASASTSGFVEALDRIGNRAASAIVGKGHIRSLALRAALARRLDAPAGAQGSFLADPVFEAARVWRSASDRLTDLAGDLLEAELVDALDAAGDRRWERSSAPYLHQLAAWRSAAAGRSYMVTSGTGSGKTECFMVPMLNDLLRQSGGRRLYGTHAIIVYPLNALIDSQRERLGAWMAPFENRLSYALYNRHMKDNLPRHEWPGGAQLPDRKALRANPASILVTNTC